MIAGLALRDARGRSRALHVADDGRRMVDALEALVHLDMGAVLEVRARLAGEPLPVRLHPLDLARAAAQDVRPERVALLDLRPEARVSVAAWARYYESSIRSTLAPCTSPTGS